MEFIPLAVFLALVAFVVWRLTKRKATTSTAMLDTSEANATLDLLLDEAEKTNELLRQLIRAYGHEPEA